MSSDFFSRGRKRRRSRDSTESADEVHESVRIHYCRRCGRFRSRRFHRENPLLPGMSPIVGVCKRCHSSSSDRHHHHHHHHRRHHVHHGHRLPYRASGRMVGERQTEEILLVKKHRRSNSSPKRKRFADSGDHKRIVIVDEHDSHPHHHRRHHHSPAPARVVRRRGSSSESPRVRHHGHQRRSSSTTRVRIVRERSDTAPHGHGLSVSERSNHNHNITACSHDVGYTHKRASPLRAAADNGPSHRIRIHVRSSSGAQGSAPQMPSQDNARHQRSVHQRIAAHPHAWGHVRIVPTEPHPAPRPPAPEPPKPRVRHPSSREWEYRSRMTRPVRRAEPEVKKPASSKKEDKAKKPTDPREFYQRTSGQRRSRDKPESPSPGTREYYLWRNREPALRDLATERERYRRTSQRGSRSSPYGRRVRFSAADEFRGPEHREREAAKDHHQEKRDKQELNEHKEEARHIVHEGGKEFEIDGHYSSEYRRSKGLLTLPQRQFSPQNYDDSDLAPVNANDDSDRRRAGDKIRTSFRHVRAPRYYETDLYDRHASRDIGRSSHRGDDRNVRYYAARPRHSDNRPFEFEYDQRYDHRRRPMYSDRPPRSKQILFGFPHVRPHRDGYTERTHYRDIPSRLQKRHQYSSSGHHRVPRESNRADVFVEERPGRHRYTRHDLSWSDYNVISDETLYEGMREEPRGSRRSRHHHDYRVWTDDDDGPLDEDLGDRYRQERQTYMPHRSRQYYHTWPVYDKDLHDDAYDRVYTSEYPHSSARPRRPRSSSSSSSVYSDKTVWHTPEVGVSSHLGSVTSSSSLDSHGRVETIDDSSSRDSSSRRRRRSSHRSRSDSRMRRDPSRQRSIASSSSNPSRISRGGMTAEMYGLNAAILDSRNASSEGTWEAAERVDVVSPSREPRMITARGESMDSERSSRTSRTARSHRRETSRSASGSQWRDRSTSRVRFVDDDIPFVGSSSSSSSSSSVRSRSRGRSASPVSEWDDGLRSRSVSVVRERSVSRDWSASQGRRSVISPVSSIGSVGSSTRSGRSRSGSRIGTSWDGADGEWGRWDDVYEGVESVVGWDEENVRGSNRESSCSSTLVGDGTNESVSSWGRDGWRGLNR